MTRKLPPPQRPNAFDQPADDPLLTRQMAGFDPAAQRRRLLDQAARLGLTLDTAALLRADGDDLYLLGCRSSAAGLEVRPDITPDELTQLAGILFALEDGIQLFIGDLLAACDTLGYGDITAIAAHYGRDEKTLRNWKYVCSSVKVSLRKDILAAYPGTKPLTIGHYNLVAALPPDQQAAYLRQAIEQGWSIADLRKALHPPVLTTTERTLPDVTRDVWRLYSARRRTPAQTRQLRTHLDELQKWLDSIRETL